MIAALRLFALLFVVLSLIYLVLSFFLRQIAQKEARDAWEKLETRIDWETYLERQMKSHNRTMRRNLILGVYVLPMSFLAAVVYFVNFA